MFYLHLYDSICAFGVFEEPFKATQYTEEFLQRPSSLLPHKQNIYNFSYFPYSVVKYKNWP